MAAWIVCQLFRCELACCAAVAVISLGCRSSQDANTSDITSAHQSASAITSVPLSPQVARGPQRFSLLSPEETGISFRQIVDTNHPLKHLYVSGHACAGVAVGDINGDAKPDLFLANHTGPNRLYIQDGDWHFIDITETAGVGGGDRWGAGVAMVDIDGDRDLDIYVCNYDAPNQLFVNQGGDRPTFKEEAAAYGLDIQDASLMPYCCDYDRDGDVDIYLVCYRYVYSGGQPQEQVYDVVDGELRMKPQYEKYFTAVFLDQRRVYVTERGRRDYLLRNEGLQGAGKTRFLDVTSDSGIYGEYMGLSAAWWDYNNDGLFDLYVANDFEHPDQLYKNLGGGKFENVITQVVTHTSYSSMGSATGDIDGDGRLDCLVLDMAATTHFKEKLNMGEMSGVRKTVLDFSEPRQAMRNSLFLSTGSGPLMEAAFMAGLAKSDWSWTPVLQDLDNDGRIDVFITNGMSRNLSDSDVSLPSQTEAGKSEWNAFEKLAPYKERNLAFKNSEYLRFANVSKEWGLDLESMSFGAASGDLDGDGDVDLVVANLDDPVSLYRNETVDSQRAVVALESPSANSHGIGAKVELVTGGNRQVRTILPTMGFNSCNQPVAHFGISSGSQIDELIVTWGSGRIDRWENLPLNQRLVITESGSDTLANSDTRSKSADQTWFEPGSLKIILPHQEKPYDDFQHQPLLPNRYSQLGPGIAWADVDGDGDNDFYLPGGAGQSGVLYRAGKTWSYFASDDKPFAADAASEGLGSLFFDADRDGDLDLYVVTGSYEFAADDPLLKDHVYVNDGKGNFTRAPDISISAESMAGGTVAGSDVDHDGDLDLFIGGRMIPRDYPASPISQLLMNETEPGGPIRLVDRTADLAPELTKTGLVTAALWSDVDRDGWTDLLVTHEWGPVKWFRNDNGRLCDMTSASGLSERLGWYNGIAGRDMDGDGDIDYVVSNFGLNTKYQASVDKPVMLYYGDYAGDGKKQIVEAKLVDGKLLPVRGKSCSTQAMPHLGERFASYRDFAMASLSDIYTDDSLESADKFVVNSLESGILWNQGTHQPDTPQFTFTPLPRLAQISPGFGIVCTEVTGDAHPDIYVVHNFFTPQRETGRMDGGVSLLLKGHKDGLFEPIAPATSGLVLPGDAKSVTVTDLNHDRRPDFVATVNNGPIRIFLGKTVDPAKIVVVRLHGAVGNPYAVGATIVVRTSDDSEQTAEVVAGSGYLGQSPGETFFGVPEGTQIEQIRVRWPDAATSEHSYEATWSQNGIIILPHPAVSGRST